MTRPRTPTQILEAKGSFLCHPERKRAREGEPKPNGLLGGPPADFDREHCAVWHEHEAKMPAGIASNWDKTAFEVLICLIFNFRRRRKEKLPQVVGEIAQMNKLFTQFGMTPADRSRVSTKPKDEKKDDPWSRLLDPETKCRQ
jgi:hypothetical protein